MVNLIFSLGPVVFLLSSQSHVSYVGDSSECVYVSINNSWLIYASQKTFSLQMWFLFGKLLGHLRLSV